MRVTHVEDHITHAVIGQGENHAFQISDSAEFFQILSSTLYSNKKLAVIREILCNAWDAHIEAGLVDMPIEVTLTAEVLIIRDFGTGLSKLHILKNYTTYGGTTKVANENVTGGFGLGSKAPFAYVDHFEVTSFHQGTMTIYNLSLSNAQVGGKPSVMPLMDVPTDESGIQVKLHLKDAEDQDGFERIIRRVAANGEMQVKLNGELLPTVPFSSAPHGFIILPSSQAGGTSNNRVYVRYGHVIYPLDSEPAIAELMATARTFLATISEKALSGFNEKWAVVLQAPPGSISVTPSRESLSMTDRTMLTVKQLLAAFNNYVSEGLTADCMELTKQAIAWGISNQKEPAKLLSYDKVRPAVDFFKNMTPTLPKLITQLPQAAAHYMCGNDYPSWKSYQHQEMQLRLQELEDRQYGDTKLISSYRHALKKLGPKAKRTNWLPKKVFWPLIQGIRGQNSLRLANLYVIDNVIRGYNSKLGHIPIRDYRIEFLREAIPFLRKIVIISHNRADILEEGKHYEEIKASGKLNKTLTYIVPRSPAKIREANEFFRAHGYTVIDRTPHQTIERTEESLSIDGVVKKRIKRVGTPKLSNLLGGTRLIDIQHAYREDNELIENPAVAVVINPMRERFERFEGFGSAASYPIIKLFGDEIALVANAIQLAKLREKGATDNLRDWVLSRVLMEFRTNKLIQKYYRNWRPADIDYEAEELQFLKILRTDEKLRKAWKLPESLPDREKMFVQIYQSFDQWDRRSIKALAPIVDLQKTWTASPAAKRVAGRLQDNPFLKALEPMQLHSLVKSPKPDIADRARQLILTSMKG